MKNPRLPGKIILSTALFLILAGMLSSIVYSNFQEFISVSHGKTTAIPPAMIEDNKLVDQLSRTSPAWRQELSKHIFITIDQELQSLEQQLILHDSAKGKRLIERVKISLQRMIFGKQKFIRTGRESSLASFYTGRTVLEYNLWKLKGLTQSLNLDRAQARGVHRVYALMNKWLIYVAHREISARRKGALGAPLLQTGEQGTEEDNAAFPQISEFAKITPQDLEDAGKILSQQPKAVQGTTPVIESKTLEPQTLESLELETRQTPQPNREIEEKTVFPQNLGEGVDSSKAASTPNWKLMLGTGGFLIISFLIFRRKRKPAHSPAFYKGGSENHLEYDDQNTGELVEIHTLIESRPAGDTGEEWPNNSERKEPATNSEASESAPSKTTTNKFESQAEEDMTFQSEKIAQKPESTLTEKEELTQGMENMLAENKSLTEKLETSQTEKEGLEKQLEILHAEKEEFTQGLKNILAENDVLTEKLEASQTEKEDFEKQLDTLRVEKETLAQELEALSAKKEEISQKLENTLAENNSLTERMEIFRAEKEDFEKQLELLRIEKEELAQELKALQSREEELAQNLENTLAENNSLTKRMEIFHAEKEDFEKQLETLRIEKEELAQELKALQSREEELAQNLESTLAESNSPAKQRETSHEEDEKERIKQEQKSADSKLKAMTKILESTRENNKAQEEEIKGLAKDLESASAEKEAIAEKLKTAQKKNKTITRQNKTLTNQLEIMQTENARITKSEHNLAHDLETLPIEIKDPKEKMESTYLKNETLAPGKPESVNTIDLSFDHDTPELMDSPAEESAVDDATTEDIASPVLNSTKDPKTETLSGEAINENQDTPSDSLPGGQEPSHPDVILLQTILKAAKGFRNINKRLYKIAETRLAPSIEDFPGNPKEEDLREI